MFEGTKGTGKKYWYGWINPAGPEEPCVETGLAGQFTLCRLANGQPCPESDLQGCEGHSDFRGWWSSLLLLAPLLVFHGNVALVAGVTPELLFGVDVNRNGFADPGEMMSDAAASVDMNLVMNSAGEFIELQGSGEESSFSEIQLAEMLVTGKSGIQRLLALQTAAIQG